MSEWKDLNCPFFCRVCREELVEFFQSEGFTRVKKGKGNGLLFLQPDVFVEVSYETESGTDYPPRLNIGLGDSPFDANLNVTCVPFWYIVPSASPQRRYSFWTFKTEETLRHVLKRIRAEIFEPYGKPLWTDHDELAMLVQDFNAEFCA